MARLRASGYHWTSWNQNDVSKAWYYNIAYLNEATICAESGSILVLSNGECDLHPQEHPIVDKLLHLGDVQSFEYGILDLVGIGHEFQGTVSFGISLIIG